MRFELEPEGRHRQEPLSLEEMDATTTDREVLGLWEAGLARWRHAFAAFGRLGLPELHTPECLHAFVDLYMGSADNREQLFLDHLDGMGWTTPVEAVRFEHAIPNDYLVWDKEAVMRGYEEIAYIVESGGRVHVFGPK